MIEASIARRYAKALVHLGKASNSLQLYLDELDQFDKTLSGHEGLRVTLSNRFLDLKARLRVVDELSTKMGLSAEVCRFIKLLIKKGRMELFPLVVKAYRKFAFELQKKKEATVASAFPLDEGAYDEIKKIFSERTGGEVLIRREINPNLLGGLRVSLGNDVYDGTLKAHLDALNDKMMKSQFI